jgi:predicted Rossmann fold nucleotide-binding protein DprA/Smf involved in DNA uptake
MIDVVVAAGVQPPAGVRMSPEQRRILALCREPTTVVDLASDIDLPVGVVRVLLSDLSQHGMIRILATPRGPVTNERLLKDVLDGLHAL